MPFDIGGRGRGRGGSGGGVKVLTRQEIMDRAEHVTRDEKTGEPLVIIPQDSELGKAVTMQHAHGFCRHFNLQQGQQECLDQQFWDRMMREEKYKAEWFDDPRTYGMCPFFDGRLMGFWHPALVLMSDIDSSLQGTKAGFEKKACPHFENVKERGSGMVMGKYHKTNIDH